MFKIIAIMLVFLNAFAAGQMRAEANAPSTSGMHHHMHSIQLSNADHADEKHQGEPQAGYHCCVGTTTHCGASMMPALQFVAHGLFQLTLEHTPAVDADMRNRLLSADPPPPKS